MRHPKESVILLFLDKSSRRRKVVHQLCFCNMTLLSDLSVLLLLLFLLFGAVTIQGCNVTLWPRARFHHRSSAGPCFFRLPSNRHPAQESTSVATTILDQQYWIEIAFSSFLMGRLVNQSCPFGHLKIEENHELESWSGTFCGRLSDSQTYLTTAESVTLYANPSSEADHFNAYFDVLSLATLRKRFPDMVASSRGLNGLQVADSRCDMTLHNCPSVCRISSPNYPSSAYPRNITCRYRVTFDRADWQVMLGGSAGDRYDLSFHPQCKADRVTIYEKTAGDDDYHQVAQFCGRGTFPKMIAQGGDVMVELTTSPEGHFHSGFRLSVSHQRRRRSQSPSIISPCHHSIATSSSPASQHQGTILSPHHWFPRNIDCTWTLKASRIWLEVHTRAKRKNNKSSAECLHRLQLPSESILCESNSSTRTVYPFLAWDSAQLRFSSQLGSLSGGELEFSVFYMLLPAEDPVLPGTVCDRVIKDASGSLDLMNDRLLLRDNKKLQCRYQFQAPATYRIRITIKQLTFDPIRQCESSMDECSNSSDRPFDSFLVSDRGLQYCFCQSTSKQTMLYSTSNRLDIQLDLKQIFNQAYKDPEIYRFRIEYNWIEDRCGRSIDDGEGGVIRWASDGYHHNCSWLIEFPNNSRILLKITSTLHNQSLILDYHGNSTRRQVDLLDSVNGEFISPFPLRFLHVQLRSGQIPFLFLLKWNVLTDPEEPLSFPCPDSNWSIPASLVCDGRINCPQRDLYGYLLDEDSCLRNRYRDYYPWLTVFIVCFGLSVLLAIVGFSTRHIRKWRELITSSPPK